MDIISIIGMPVVMNSTLLNSAVVFQKGKILGIVPKTYLPNYKEFYEQRWFTSALNHPDANVRLCGQKCTGQRQPAFRHSGNLLWH